MEALKTAADRFADVVIGSGSGRGYGSGSGRGYGSGSGYGDGSGIKS